MKVMNELRPVALTSAIMKVFERVVLSQLQSLVANFLDPLQFAYRRGRGAEDAVFHVLHNIFSSGQILFLHPSHVCLIFFSLSHTIQSGLTYWQRNS